MQNRFLSRQRNVRGFHGNENDFFFGLELEAVASLRRNSKNVGNVFEDVT